MKLKTIVETEHVVDETSTEYVPGFLAFREGPMLLRIVSRIQNTPNVFLIDGQGVAHPRGFGLASHVGLALDRPTIGVAKSRLYGRVEGGSIIGADHNIIGRILDSEAGKRFYVSVGHRISLDTAIKTVGNCMVDGFPAPLRRAHLDSLLLKRNAAA
jgi:deoxyribonuclease V